LDGPNNPSCAEEFPANPISSKEKNVVVINFFIFIPRRY